MEDLFQREQDVLSSAESYLVSLQEGEQCSREAYEKLLKEYGKFLKQMRNITKISDKTAEELNMTKLSMARRAYHDTLTGVYNRRYMEEQLDKVMRTLEQKKEVLSVIMIDVDFFKRYNDTYGHSRGDECLIRVAGALSGGIRSNTDFLARYGGEEFVAVLPGAGKEEACMVTERVLEQVRKCRIRHEHNDAADYVTISAGVTAGIIDGRQKKEDFIKRADEAMYRSKQSGRNQYTFLWYEEE